MQPPPLYHIAFSDSNWRVLNKLLFGRHTDQTKITETHTPFSTCGWGVETTSGTPVSTRSVTQWKVTFQHADLNLHPRNYHSLHKGNKKASVGCVLGMGPNPNYPLWLPLVPSSTTSEDPFMLCRFYQDWSSMNSPSQKGHSSTWLTHRAVSFETAIGHASWRIWGVVHSPSSAHIAHPHSWKSWREVRMTEWSDPPGCPVLRAVAPPQKK